MNFASKAMALLGRYATFLWQFRHFRSEAARMDARRFPLPQWRDRLPMLWEATAQTRYDAHYVYHTAWAVRKVVTLSPTKHVDISSTLNFCTTLSAIVPVDFYDYRPAPIDLPGLTCGHADLLGLPFESGSIESISCMHVIEHIGLGRYGDPIDPAGDLKAARELARVVAPGGYLIMVAPVGKSRVAFNAHRVYGCQQLLAMFPGFDLVETAMVRDNGSFGINVDPVEFDQQHYGCGCFLLQKRSTL